MTSREIQYVRRARTGWFDFKLDELWAYRDLLGILVWRNLLVRYKQSAVGVCWAVLRPALQMIVFSLIFGGLAKMDSEGYPYPVFMYAGLLPWTYFSTTVSSGSGSLLAGGNMISKVYFPRMILPLSYLLTSLVDLLLAMLLLFGMMVFYHAELSFGFRVLTFPLFLLPAMLTAAGLSMGLSALAVRYRDIHHLVPFLLQLGMFITPVVYAVTLLPKSWQWLIQLNPMTGVVEGFRWALLGKPVEGWGMLCGGAGLSVLVLFCGLIIFQRIEKTLADIL